MCQYSLEAHSFHIGLSDQLQKVQGCRRTEGNMHDLALVGCTEPVFALDDAEIVHEAQR